MSSRTVLLTFFAVFLAISASPTRADTPTDKGRPLTLQQITEQANVASKSRQFIERRSDGRVRMNAPMQAMEAIIGTEGISVHSINAGGSAAFGWRVSGLGRAQRVEPLADGSIAVDDDIVSLRHPNLIEQFSADGDGIRQDFVVANRPAGDGDLVLELAIDGARLETLPNRSDQAVVLRMADGRLLHYHALSVIDANGKAVAARMQLAGAQRLRIDVADADARYPLRIDPTFSDADWTALAGPDFNDGINAIVVGDGKLYVGGAFTTTPSGSVDRIAQWNGDTWSGLGSGMNSIVTTLVWNNGRLIAGGGFTSAGGNTANRIAQWDGTGWSTLGSGLNGNVAALAWNGSKLYAGGNFTIAGGISANRIAQWDGSTWSALGSGMDYSVNALVLAGTTLYAGGDFTTVDGDAIEGIAQWNGTSWTPLGSGTNARVTALASDGKNLYTAGAFTIAGGTWVNGFARWDGGTWMAFGEGLNDHVFALAWGNGRLFVAGDKTVTGGILLRRVMQWDGSTWSVLGNGVDNGGVSALVWNGDKLYAGGTFTAIGGKAANRFAQWDGATWSAFGSGINGAVKALAWDGKTLYAAGSFTTIGSVAANHIAQWDGNVWSPLGSGLTYPVGPLSQYVDVYALAYGGGRLYVGGVFTVAGTTAANNIAQWDGSTWTALRDGLYRTGGWASSVNSLAWDGNRLYAGGDFLISGNSQSCCVAMWNDDTWTTVGSGGFNGTVNAIYWHGGRLYAGGGFTTAGGTTANHVALWDGNAWTALGKGTNGTVLTFAWNDDTLYAGGYFGAAGANAANNVAQWDGTAWSAVGNGTNGTVMSLAYDGSRLYASGGFTTAGGNPANYIAQWDGNTWSALGSGADKSVNALIWDSTNHRLIAGGAFSSAGGKPAAIAAAHIRNAQATLTITATPKTIAYDGTSTLDASGGSGSGAIIFAVTDGTGYCSVDGNTLTGIGVGICTVTATKAGDVAYYDATATLDVSVTPAIGSVAFDGLAFVYDGSVKNVTAHIAEEPGAACTVAPSSIGPDAGSYTVGATCNGIHYVASGSATATIDKAAGAVAFDTLDFTYDGATKSVAAHIAEEPATSCVVSPASVGPGAGDYPVSVTDCVGANYTASGSATATIARAASTVDFDALDFTYDGSTKSVTAHVHDEPATTCAVSPATIGPDAGNFPVSVTDCEGANYAASGSATAAIAKATSTTTLASNCMRSFVESQPFTLRASVSGIGSIGGGVTFDDGAARTLCSQIELVGGIATCTSSMLAANGDAPASYRLGARYDGDDNHLPSAAATPIDVVVLSLLDVVLRDGFESPIPDCPIE